MKRIVLMLLSGLGCAGTSGSDADAGPNDDGPVGRDGSSSCQVQCDDSLACTMDDCESDSCTHTIAANTCLIGGACYAAGDANPEDACETCEAGVPTQWSRRDCNDGLACTRDECSGGVCQHPVQEGACLIGGFCYVQGEANPLSPCSLCTPSVSQQTWATGCNDGIACTYDYCYQNHCYYVANPGWCWIDATCYADGDTNPDDACQACRANPNPDDWSARCDDLRACTMDSCDAGACTNAIISGFCLIDGICRADGDGNTAPGACQGCDPASSTTAWSPRTCDDTLSCSADSCIESFCSYWTTGGYCPGNACSSDCTSLFFENLEDGDFTANPTGVASQSCNPSTCGTITQVVVVDEPQSGGHALRLARTTSFADGATSTVSYVGPWTVPSGALHLRYKVKDVLDELNSGGWGYCVDYSVRVNLLLKLSDDSTESFYIVHNYGVSNCLPGTGIWLYQRVPRDTWVENDIDVSQILTDRGYPAATSVEQLTLSGAGWDFTAVYDDIEVYVQP